MSLLSCWRIRGFVQVPELGNIVSLSHSTHVIARALIARTPNFAFFLLFVTPNVLRPPSVLLQILSFTVTSIRGNTKAVTTAVTITKWHKEPTSGSTLYSALG